MTRVEDTAHTSELGVQFVARTCARAKVIFRPVRMYDVGIDGMIEPQHGNIASGNFIGVQVKAGASFVTDAGRRFCFKSDREHFSYWARCAVPVVGVVYDPSADRAAWFNLTSLATPNRIARGPYSECVSIELALLTPRSLLHSVIPGAAESALRRNLRRPKLVRQPGTPKEVVSRDESWEDLLSVFLSTLHTDRQVASAGYRLSLYFPREHSDARRQYALECLSEVNDLQLAKMLSAVDRAIREDHDHVAENLVDLISYIPNARERIEFLLANNSLRRGAYLGAIQTVEVLEQTFREDLWRLHPPSDGEE